MIIETINIQNACSKILKAVDSNVLSEITETVELLAKNGAFTISVTNKEYFVKISLPIEEDVVLHATVNANTFLKLISQITTETIELNSTEKELIIKGNGIYHIPIIFENDKILELPELTINNKTIEFDINNDILQSIVDYNSKELLKGTISKPVQRFYYLDEKGCITFTSGACVNNFTLEKPIKILLNDKLVKLFKLFATTKVHFSLGYDPITEDIIQTKVSFVADGISLTAVLSCDDTFLNSVPVTAIRGRVESNYPYSITVNKDKLLATINRLLIFKSTDTLKQITYLQFKKDELIVLDSNKKNFESVFYENIINNMQQEYNACVKTDDLRLTLENCNEKYITISFGNEEAFLISRANIHNIIQESQVEYVS